VDYIAARFVQNRMFPRHLFCTRVDKITRDMRVIRGRYYNYLLFPDQLDKSGLLRGINVKRSIEHLPSTHNENAFNACDRRA